MAKERAAPVTRQRARQVAPAGKENQPPQKSRKTVNVNAMYDAPQSHKRKRIEEEEEAETFVQPVSCKKSRVVEPGFFTNLARKQQEQPAPKPDFFSQTVKSSTFGFGDALKSYSEAVEASYEERFAAYQQQIKNLEDGLGEDGNELEVPIPTEADLEALRDQIIAAGRPLEDDEVAINPRQPDGSIKAGSLSLGELLDKCIEKSGEKRAEIESIEKKLRKVEKEIGVLKMELERELATTADEDESELEKQMAKFQEEIDAIEQEAEDQREQLERELKKDKKEFARKMQGALD